MVEGCEKSPQNPNMLTEEYLKNATLDASDPSLSCTNLVLLQIQDYPRIESASTKGFNVTSVTIVSDMSVKK